MTITIAAVKCFGEAAMLYLLDVEIDYARMGERVVEIRAAEHARVRELIAQKTVVVEWLKANGRGVYAVWDCASHDELRRLLADLPMSPYLSRVDLHPLTEHPLFPAGRPAGPLCSAGRPDGVAGPAS